MTIIVFLIDTSASMNQRVYLGGRPKLLDVAKGAVESFVKGRQKAPDSKFDRYMLLTFEDPPNNIKAGWKESLNVFMTELKNLQCVGLTTMGTALKHVFDLLNINRIQTGIDTYGSGRCPYFLEPVVIVVITDGGKLTNSMGVVEEFNLPMHSPVLGSELTREPFRWDQRLFSLVLRLGGTPLSDRDAGHVASDPCQIDIMCEVTGGRSYSITTQRMLQQCIDSLVLKVQCGVVINFEKVGPDPVSLSVEKEMDVADEPQFLSDVIQNKSSGNSRGNGNTNSVTVAPWHSCRKLIYVPKNPQKIMHNGHWPIPESFWPDTSYSTLPPRSAHPNIKFNCTSQEPLVIENLPFDKYELEPSPLTQYILARKQPTVCWQVFVPNSYKNPEVIHPFGYLKASTNLSCVNLFVMPYNYPVLLPLLDEFFKVHRLKVTPEWRCQFQNYVRMMPAYYCQPLRKALEKMGVPKATVQMLLPETLDNNIYNHSIQNYLKKLKIQGKSEYDKMCNEISNKQALGKTVPEGIRVVPRSSLKKELISHPSLQKKFAAQREQLNDYAGLIIALSKNSKEFTRTGCQSYRNPFDIPRVNLLDQVFRLRSNFLQKNVCHTKLVDDDVAHSMPVSQMGNYQEYLKRTPAPLREIESMPVRTHTFGNPFKIDKRMVIDEADIDMMGGASLQRSANRRPGTPDIVGRLPPKRKPGPIPQHVQYRKRSVSEPVEMFVPVDETPADAPFYANGYFDDMPLPTWQSDDARVRSPSPPPLDALMAPAPPERCDEDAPPPPLSLMADYTPPGEESRVSARLLDRRELEDIRKYNLNLRTSIYKEVKRFGRNHHMLFEYIRMLKGPPNEKARIINDARNESLRYKRINLAEMLRDYLEKTISTKENGRTVLRNGFR